MTQQTQMVRGSQAAQGSPRPRVHGLLVVGALLLGVLGAGCGNISAAQTGIPTATPPPSCAQLPGFGAAGAATAGQAFADVSFPLLSVSMAPVASLGGAGQFALTQIDVCTPQATVAGLQASFAAQLGAQGWASSKTYPYDGAYQAPCGDTSCWAKGTAPRLVALEQVTDAGGGRVTYHLRLATPPPAPTCPAGQVFQPPYHTFLGPDATPMLDMPLPPLTTGGGGSGSSDGAFEAKDIPLCSAGTAASIDAFMASEYPKLGWQQGVSPDPSLCGAGTWLLKGKRAVQWNTQTLAGQGVWYVSTCFAPGA
jgi:hypothetical protein